MIVRDEAAMLPGLLASVAGLWDELVVADTGSTDGTADLLAAAGARMVAHAWQDDFAAARNASLAAATGRWILVLDADERVTPGLAAEIHKLLADPDAGAATLVMRNEMPGGHRRDADLLRLFRNDPEIRYRHRIHEDPSASVRDFLARENLALRRLTGVVHHLGYVREVAAARNKKERDVSLLKALVEENPSDLYSWYKLLEAAHFWEDDALAATLAPDAARALDQADAPTLRRQLWSGDLAMLLARVLHPEPEAALAWLAGREDRIRPSAGWHLARGMWLEAAGDQDAAGAAFAAALVAARRPDSAVAPVRALLGQARLAAARGDLEEARTLALRAAADTPRDPEALLAAVGFCRLAPGPDALTGFIMGHGAADPGAREDLARALLAAGEPGLSMNLLAACGDAQPATALGLLVCSVLTDRPVDLEIALDQESADAALRDWLRVLWRSRQTALMARLADRLDAFSPAFPWVPEFLQEETRSLRHGSP